MRQKFAITVADVPMNIVCDEKQETVDTAVTMLDRQVRALTSDKAHSCTKTEAALLTAARVHHGTYYSVRVKKIVRERVKARYGSAGLILVECKSLYSRSANANAGE